MWALTLTLLGIGVVLGTASQRITGMGFALLMAPFFALVFGAYEGVLLMNVGGLVSSALVLSKVWRDVDWKRFALLFAGAIPGGILGGTIAITLNSATLQIVVGMVLVMGLSASLLITPRQHKGSLPGGALLAGCVSGLTNATAGIGGPPIGIYALSTGWPQRHFSATLQPLFVAISISALVVKMAFSGATPGLSWWMYLAMVCLILLGLRLGGILKPLVKEEVGRKAVVLFCYVGAVSALIDGLWVVFHR